MLSTPRPGSLLLDNSTYFASRSLLDDGAQLSPELVYNLASFLECLVIADKTFLAPTNFWHPDPSNPLFRADGPCSAIVFEGESDDSLRELFEAATTQSIMDLSSSKITTLLPLLMPRTMPRGPVDPGAVQWQMSQWLDPIAEDPRTFIDVYSVGVFMSDPQIWPFLKTLPRASLKDPQATLERHVAQYLLRTNVAVELGRFVPYHPHSHRVAFVVAKGISADSAPTSLLRTAESDIARRLSLWHTTQGTTPEVEVDIPLVLAVVLSGASDPSDVLPLTLGIRDSKEARGYRLWVQRVAAARASGDPRTIEEAENEKARARELLGEELERLYARSRAGLPRRISRFVRVLGAPLAEDPSASAVRSAAVKLTVSTLERLQQRWQDRQLRPPVAFLLGLARQRQKVGTLNPLLQRVFHQGLDAEQLARLRRLRDYQVEAITSLGVAGDTEPSGHVP